MGVGVSSRVGRGVLVGRGVSAAAVATFAVTVSHSASAGVLPSVWAIVVAFVAASVVCVPLAGRRLSWWRLSVAVGLSQLFFHLLLSVDFGVPVGGAAISGHAHHDVLSAVPGLSGAVASAASPLMWVAHVVAAFVTVLAFGFGERAVAAVLGFVRSVLRALRPVRTLPVRPGRLTVVTVVRFAPRSVVLSVVRRRGPPVWTV
jgi:hypothetical protein